MDPETFSKTLGSVAQVEAIIQLVEDSVLNPKDTLKALAKIGKAATRVIVENRATSVVNEGLVEALKMREKRSNKNREEGTKGLYARVCGEEEFLRR